MTFFAGAKGHHFGAGWAPAFMRAVGAFVRFWESIWESFWGWLGASFYYAGCKRIREMLGVHLGVILGVAGRQLLCGL